MKYVVVVTPRTDSVRYIQISDPHSWSEIEAVYLDYMERYEGCNVVIWKYVRE